MSVVRKIMNEDGTYTVLAGERPVRFAANASEADDAVRSLSYLDVGDEMDGRPEVAGAS